MRLAPSQFTGMPLTNQFYTQSLARPSCFNVMVNNIQPEQGTFQRRRLSGQYVWVLRYQKVIVVRKVFRKVESKHNVVAFIYWLNRPRQLPLYDWGIFYFNFNFNLNSHTNKVYSVRKRKIEYI